MISTGNCVYIGDITAFVLVIYRIAANSELRQKSLRLGLDYEIKSCLCLDRKVLLFTSLLFRNNCYKSAERQYSRLYPSDNLDSRSVNVMT